MRQRPVGEVVRGAVAALGRVVGPAARGAVTGGRVAARRLVVPAPDDAPPCR